MHEMKGDDDNSVYLESHVSLSARHQSDWALKASEGDKDNEELTTDTGIPMT